MFFDYSSFGKKHLTDGQIEKIQPLIEGQKSKEITIKMVVCEMSEWWSNGWGWIYPLWDMIENESDPVMLKVWRHFERIINRDGFEFFLRDYSGLSLEEKGKYVDRKYPLSGIKWLQNIPDRD